MADVHTRALTAALRIKPTSTRCQSAWRPNPGRPSTYRRGDSVQTTGTSSLRSNAVFQTWLLRTRQLGRQGHLQQSSEKSANEENPLIICLDERTENARLAQARVAYSISRF